MYGLPDGQYNQDNPRQEETKDQVRQRMESALERVHLFDGEFLARVWFKIFNLFDIDKT